MDDCEGREALSFEALLAEGKEKEESFGLEVGDAEVLESGREGIRIADIEETAIELELGFFLSLSRSPSVERRRPLFCSLLVDCTIILIFFILILFLSVIWAGYRLEVQAHLYGGLGRTQIYHCCFVKLL